MKQRLQGIVIGVLATVLLLGTVTVVAAATRTIQVTHGVNVVVNGIPQHFAEDMRPMMAEGRTFLPVRGIADALGLDVVWDGVTSTVFLTAPAPVVPAIPAPIPTPIPAPIPAPIPDTAPVPAPIPTPELAPVPESTPAPPPTPGPPTAQNVPLEWQNALESGRNYLRVMSFSYSSLSAQLEFESFPAEAVAWAMAQLDAETDWRAQAVMSGENYIRIMNFSRSGLIDQLVFEGFSREDATYAANRLFDDEAAAVVPTPVPVPVAASATSLIGDWHWMGQPYYVFHADGRGTMAGMDMRWSASGGVLSVCSTPNLCQNNCVLPTEWYYTIQGNQLTLTSRTISSLTFTYTRG